VTHLNQIESNWELIKNQIHKKWSNLSLSEIEKTGADFYKLLALINQKNNNEFTSEDDLNHIIRDNRSKTLRHNPNFYEAEYDEIDDEGMISIDSHTADYSGLGLTKSDSNEIQLSPQKEIELPLRPDKTEIGTEKNNEPNTTPDETIQNLSPLKNFEEIPLGRSHSSANTTSPSAFNSSEVTKGM